MDTKEKNPTQERKIIPNFGDQRIDEARGNLDQIRRRTEQEILKIKTETDEVENNRRTLEEKTKKERADKIQNEVIQSHKKNVEIDWNWQELEEKEDCKELAEDIEAQKQACMKIIQDKEALINEFKEQLKKKDSHYIKQMSKMSLDIEYLINKMSDQFNTMRQAYVNELQNIEADFERERTEIIERNNKEIEFLFNKHKAEEQKHQRERQQLEDTNARELEDVMTQDANKQVEMKIKLSLEIQTLEKCMEDMKAVYKLNEEKLSFNHDLIVERQLVNTRMLNNLNKRAQKYKENMHYERDNCLVKQQEAQRWNNKLTSDYKKFTELFKDLQRKFLRFEKIDDTRYNDVRRMNELEANNLVEKIMHADKMIHLQQLSIKWEPPKDRFFDFLHESGAINGIGGEGSVQGGDSNTQGNSVMNQNTSIMDSQNKDGQAHSRSEIVDEAQSAGTGKGRDATKEKYERIKNVFRLLIAEAPFLIDDKASEKAQGLPLKEQFGIKIDSIRKSLGIEEMADVYLLVEVLYGFQEKYDKEQEEEEERIRQNEAEEMAGQGEEALNTLNNEHKKPNENAPNGGAVNGTGQNGEHSQEEEEEDPNKLKLESRLLTLALQEFHSVREERESKKELMNQRNKKKTKETKAADKAKDTSNQKKNIERYWNQMTTILSPQKLSVWKALDKALVKYYQLLVDRQNLIEETGLLNQQNEELKTLLNQYLQAGVNQELQVPPTQVIRLDI